MSSILIDAGRSVIAAAVGGRNTAFYLKGNTGSRKSLLQAVQPLVGKNGNQLFAVKNVYHTVHSFFR